MLVPNRTTGLRVAPSYESVRDFEYNEDEWERVLYNRQRTIVGTPDVVKAKILKMAKDFNTDEIVMSTFADSFEDRLRSYEILAESFALRAMEGVAS